MIVSIATMLYITPALPNVLIVAATAPLHKLAPSNSFLGGCKSVVVRGGQFKFNLTQAKHGHSFVPSALHLILRRLHPSHARNTLSRLRRLEASTALNPPVGSDDMMSKSPSLVRGYLLGGVLGSLGIDSANFKALVTTL